MSNSDVLTKLGENATISLKEADPVNCCLDGYFFNCPENPMRFEKGLCNDYMAQRCARNWDNYCDVYLSQLDSKDVNGLASTNFLRASAEAKFCRDDTSNPNAQCVTYCEQMNPLAPGGAVVCKSVGETIYRDQNQLYNISTDFSQSEGLNTTAPLKATSCPKVCDVIQQGSLDNKDRVLNECLDRGVCQGQMMKLAQTLAQNNVPIQNDRLKQFMNQYIVENSQNQLAQSVQLGKNSPQIANFNPTVPGPSPQNMAKEGFEMPPAPSQQASQPQQMNLLAPSKENFAFPVNPPKQNTAVTVLLVIIFVITGLIALFMTTENKFPSIWFFHPFVWIAYGLYYSAKFGFGWIFKK